MSKQYFLGILIALVGCGSSGGGSSNPPKPLPADIKALVQTYCVACHQESIIYRGAAKLKDRSMPKQGSPQAQGLSESDRAKLTSFAENPNQGSSNSGSSGGGY